MKQLPFASSKREVYFQVQAACDRKDYGSDGGGGWTMAYRFELYKDAKAEFRWRLVATNGQTIATAGEGYTTKANAQAGIDSVKKNAATAIVEEKTG
jgi:uncharacterized protein YegP (UPF0339 family)